MSARVSVFVAALACAAGADAQQLRTYTQFPAGPTSLAYGLPVPLPLDSLTPVDGFRSYASIDARLHALALESSDLAAHDVGRTIGNRPVWAYVVSDEDGTDIEGRPEAAFFINASTHAREWATPEVSTGTIERMVAGAGDGGLVRYLLDNTRLVIIPVHNIDGVLQTQRYPTDVLVGLDPQAPGFPADGRMRRKNMRGADEVLTTPGDALSGVDLNRNHPPFWATTTGSSPNPNSEVFHGSGAHSEPESEALAAAAMLAPVTRIRLGFDVHTHAAAFLSANTGRTRLNEIQGRLVSRMIQHHGVLSGKQYNHQTAPSNQGIGTADQYFAFNWLVPAWTLELEPATGAQEYGGSTITHGGFILPASQARRVRESWAETNLVAFYMMSGPAHLSRVRYVDVQTGKVAAQGRWRHDVATARRVRVNEVAGWLEPGVRYRVELGFSKPMRFRNAAGQIAPLPGSVANGGPPTVALLQGTTRTVVDVAGGAWIDDPARVLRYRDDTYAFEFTAPAALGDYRLEVGAPDMTGLALDSDPATPADWAQGAWSEYEDSTGADGDVGGNDTQAAFAVAVERVRVVGTPSTLAGEGDAVAFDVELPAPATALTTLAVSRGTGFEVLTQWQAGQADRRALQAVLPDDVLVQGDRDQPLELHLLADDGSSSGVAAILPLRVLDNDSADLVVLRAKLDASGDFTGAPAGATRALVLDRRDYFATTATGAACTSIRFDGPLTVYGNGAQLRPADSGCGDTAVYDGRAGRVELDGVVFSPLRRGSQGAATTVDSLLAGQGDLALRRTRFTGIAVPAGDPARVLLRAENGGVDIARSRFDDVATSGGGATLLRFRNAQVRFDDSYVRGVTAESLVSLDGGGIALHSATLDARATDRPALALSNGATASWRASLAQGEGALCNAAGSSSGYNVFSDASCVVAQETDVQAGVALPFDPATQRYAPPAIGPDLVVGECHPVDVRGAPRPQSPTGGVVPPRCDAGAFEHGLNPFRGIWGFSRPGHGIDLQTLGNRIVLAWYTHDANGEPTAYQANAPFTGPRWAAVLQQPSRDMATGRASATDVGNIVLEFTDATHATVRWTLGTETGEDTLVASQFASGAPRVEASGLWYPPADSGHGATVSRRGDVTAVATYYYDATGRVRWALGTGTGADAQRMAMAWSNRAGEVRPAGSIVAHFRTPRHARIALDLVYPGSAGGNWNRAPADYVPISDPVDNDDALR